MSVHFNIKSMLLFYYLTIKHLSFPITQPMQIDFLQMYFLWMANICPAKHNVFFCSSLLQRWVFSLWLSSLATEHQSASRFVVRGDYSVGCDQHIAKPGEIPYLLNGVCLSGQHLMVRLTEVRNQHSLSCIYFLSFLGKKVKGQIKFHFESIWHTTCPDYPLPQHQQRYWIDIQWRARMEPSGCSM